MHFKSTLSGITNIISCILICSITTQAQIFLPDEIISKWSDDQLQLRWEPASIPEWQQAIQSGYNIEIFRIDGENKVALSSKTVKPLSSQQYSETTTTINEEFKEYYNSCHALLYPDDRKDHEIAELIDMLEKSHEHTVDSFRLSFLSFYSSLNIDLAEANALGATIPLKFSGECRIVLTVEGFLPREIITNGPTDKLVNNRIPKLTAEWNDRMVSLQWDTRDRYKTYFGYYIEKSINGSKFSRISTLPILDPAVGIDGSKQGESLSYQDSLHLNYVPIKFRLKPIDYFGNVSEHFSEVSGYGFKVIQTSPILTLGEQMPDNSAHLVWQVKASDMSLIKDFSVLRSDEANGKYEIVMDSISKTFREIYIPMTYERNFFRVETNPIDGKSLSSMPVFVIGIDSIPPALPVVIKGIIDTNNVVRILWHPNTESDLWGYRIFKANFKTEEYALMNATPTLDTFFIDTLSSRLATEKVYYLLQSVDNRNNRSEFTEPIIIVKPDKFPPGFGMIASLKQFGDTVSMYWIPSASNDVVEHEFYRKDVQNDDHWTLIGRIGRNTIHDSVFIDTKLELERQYAYTMRAIDDAGLYSSFADLKLITLEKITEDKDPINILHPVINKEKNEVTIQWEVNDPELFRSVLIYRGFEANKIGKYKYVDAPSMSFTELLPESGSVFYQFKPVFEEQTEFFISDVIRIESAGGGK